MGDAAAARPLAGGGGFCRGCAARDRHCADLARIFLRRQPPKCIDIRHQKILDARRTADGSLARMPSKPIPGSTGEVLTCLPSPYLPHPATGLLYLPRFIAKCRYVKAHGALPASYAKNYKRGLDRFLSLHLGVDPAAVEKAV